MAFKKVTYTLPIEAVNQINNLSKRYGKSKSGIIADLIMNTESKQDKLLKKIVHLESNKKVTFKDMEGIIKTDKEFDPVELRNKVYLDKVK
ncbi:MAG: hypothetical protein LBD03_05075 [Methanobrevibacter sp.]|jgi:hypothetical protein|nr:hypothetical protein [Candidatus Methanovirga procula]